MDVELIQDDYLDEAKQERIAEIEWDNLMDAIVEATTDHLVIAVKNRDGLAIQQAIEAIIICYFKDEILERAAKLQGLIE